MLKGVLIVMIWSPHCPQLQALMQTCPMMRSSTLWRNTLMNGCWRSTGDSDLVPASEDILGINVTCSEKKKQKHHAVLGGHAFFSMAQITEALFSEESTLQWQLYMLTFSYILQRLIFGIGELASRKYCLYRPLFLGSMTMVLRFLLMQQFVLHDCACG